MEASKKLSDDLTHHGVKGMHWGKRKAVDDTPNRRYSKSNREIDTTTFGKNGVQRINRRLNAGKTYKQAVVREAGRQTLIRAGVVMGVGVAAILAEKRGVLVHDLLAKAETNRGRAAAANIMGIGSKVSATPFTKAHRGVYKITTM